MKKLFYGIGILIAVFTIYFSLLYADKKVYVNDSYVYDIMLSKSITGKELEQYAQNNDVMIQLLKHHNVSFGKTDIENIIINPEEGIHSGRQKSVFPKYNIEYVVDESNANIIMENFVIQTDEENKIISFCDELSQNGYSCDYYCSGNLRFSLSMLFSKLNAEFYLLFFILSILFIFMYYIYRLKEMGILRMNGWSSVRISLKIIMPMARDAIVVSMIFMMLFFIYVYIMDKSFLGVCLKIYGLNILFLIVVFGLAAIVATVFIRNMNQVNAIKNGRNNRIIFYSLVVVKLIVVFFVFSEICRIKNDMIIFGDIKKAAQEIEKRDLYKIIVSNCNEEEEEKITTILSEIPDDEIFNFGISILNTYSITDLNQGIQRQMINDDFYNVMYLSDNMVSNMKIRDSKGDLLDNLELEKNEVCYLIPHWMKNYMEEISEYSAIDNTSQIIYIQDDQTYPHFFWPDAYIHDSIIQVHALDKELFPKYSDEVLLTKKAADSFNSKMIKMGLSSFIVNAESANMDSDLCISNAEIELWEAFFYFIMMLVAYTITSISIILIYFEFKKKLLSVYLLSGRIPVKSIIYFCALNELIVVIGTTMTEKMLLGFIIIELLFYGYITYVYLQKKAIYILKGE